MSHSQQAIQARAFIDFVEKNQTSLRATTRLYQQDPPSFRNTLATLGIEFTPSEAMLAVELLNAALDAATGHAS